MDEPALIAAVARLGLKPKAGAAATRLTGGVSCDIFRVELEDGPVCVKQALPKLRVAADWHAPVERAESEVRWLKLAGDLGRPRAPRVIAQSEADHLFVMEFLDPAAHPNWKAELAAGRIDLDVAAAVGRDLAHIHAATAYKPSVAADFATGDLFRALRIEPYLLHTATKHADLSAKLTALAEDTLDTEMALVHGDVSPKNILAGPDGPVFLDAECAWFGDPAFDLAFCQAHLLLKCVWKPAHRADYLEAFYALSKAYVDDVRWEPKAGFDLRGGALLAALLLARIDGKSPVEYLTADADRSFVRDAARRYVAADAIGMDEIAWDWADRLETR